MPSPVNNNQGTPNAGALMATGSTLPGMSNDVTDELISYNPDSVLILRVVSRELQRNCDDFLQRNADEILMPGSRMRSPLYHLICSSLGNFYCTFIHNPGLMNVQFHLSIPRTIRSLGVPAADCPDRILSTGEISRFNDEVQNIQDANLPKIWGPLREQIMTTGQQPAGIPNADASAQQIRSWMGADANQPVLQRITRLDLRDCALTCVPLEIRLCTALQRLSLDDNQIASLPATVFQGLTSLEGLSIKRNQIASLPATVFQGLTSLRRLILDGNQIASLPPNIFRGLTSLESLLLGYNDIASLPATVFQGLTSLEGLNLDSNQIASLPATIFQGLTSLRTLNLDDNQIASLPATIFQGLTSLNMLFLRDNPRLLIYYKDLEIHSNNIELPDMMRAFFNYTCQSPFAQLYQLAAGGGSPEAVKESFSGLPDNIKNAIYGKVWVEAGRPDTDDPKWREHYTFDSMPIFYGALKRYVRESFEGLNRNEKNAVHFYECNLAMEEGIDVDSILEEDGTHAHDNILRLIDAMMQLEPAAV